MARAAKNGHYWNGKLSQIVYDSLVGYAADTGLSQTCIVEHALTAYLEEQFSKEEGKPVTLKQRHLQNQIRGKFEE